METTPDPRFKQPHRGEYEPVHAFLQDFIKHVETDNRSSIDGDVSSLHYGRIFKICSSSGPTQEFIGGSDWCWAEYQHLISDYLREHVFPLLQKEHSISAESFLRRYVRSWKNFQTFLSLAVFTFSYLDAWQLKNGPFTLLNRAYELWASELFDPIDYKSQDVAKWYDATHPQQTPAAPTTTMASGKPNKPNPQQQQQHNHHQNPYRLLQAIYTTEEQKKAYEKSDEAPPATGKDAIPTPQHPDVTSSPILSDSIKILTYKSFLQLCSDERNGTSIDTSLLREFTQSLTDLGRLSAFDSRQEDFVMAFYKQLEQRYIQQVRTYYTAEINVQELDFKEYTTKMNDIFAAEQKRVQAYLHTSTTPVLDSALHEITLRNTLEEFLSKPGAMEFFCSSSNHNYTQTLFNLLADHSDTTHMFAKKMGDYVTTLGKQLITEYMAKQTAFDEHKAKKLPPPLPPKPDPIQLIQQVIEKDLHFRKIVDQDCKKSPIVSDAVTKASELFLNLQETLISQTLALFAHSLLSNRSKVQQSAKTSLESVAQIFKYLRNKDIFEQEYQRYLCNRILSGDSLGTSNEQEALRALVKESGSDFARKAANVETDLEVSKGLTTTFVTDRNEFIKKHSVELSFNVCTTNGGWVFQKSQYAVQYDLTSGLTQVTNQKKSQGRTSALEGSAAPQSQHVNDFQKLPQVFQEVWQQFGQFYCQTHERRYLEFYLDEGVCELTYVPDITSPHVVKTLVCTPIMAVILIHLSKQKGPITFKDLAAQLALDIPLLSEHLLPLALPFDQPTRCIVRKAPSTPGFKEDDKLLLSKQYQSNNTKIFIPFQRKLTAEDKQEQHKELLKLRMLALKSAIVRFLKMRKSCHHHDLVIEINKQVSNRFTAQPQMIKDAVEALITDEFIDRDPEDRQQYHYRA